MRPVVKGCLSPDRFVPINDPEINGQFKKRIYGHLDLEIRQNIYIILCVIIF